MTIALLAQLWIEYRYLTDRPPIVYVIFVQNTEFGAILDAEVFSSSFFKVKPIKNINWPYLSNIIFIVFFDQNFNFFETSVSSLKP